MKAGRAGIRTYATLAEALAARTREPRPVAFRTAGSIPWEDPDLGRSFVRFEQPSEERTREQLSFLRREIFPGPCRVLDLMCADGRLAIPLANRGHEVVGVDVNRALIEDAEKRWDQSRATASGAALFRCGDVSGLRRALAGQRGTLQPSGARHVAGPLDVEPFDVALCIFGMLSTFERSRARDLLIEVRSVLADQSLVVIDMHLSAAYIEELDRQQDWDFYPDGWLTTDSPALVLDEYLTEADSLTFVRRSLCHELESGRVSELLQAGQFYDRAGMAALLAESGFEPVAWWGEFDSSPYEPGSSSNLIVAARPSRARPD